MEHNFFTKKGNRAFNLIVIGWPVAIVLLIFLYWALFSTLKFFLENRISVLSWINFFHIGTSLFLITFSIFHYRVCRKWNSELEERALGERLFFIRGEFFGIIPFVAGLYILILKVLSFI